MKPLVNAPLLLVSGSLGWSHSGLAANKGPAIVIAGLRAAPRLRLSPRHCARATESSLLPSRDRCSIAVGVGSPTCGGAQFTIG